MYLYLLYPYISYIFYIYLDSWMFFQHTGCSLQQMTPRPLVAYMIREVECFEPLWVDDSDSFFLLTIYPEKQKQEVTTLILLSV